MRACARVFVLALACGVAPAGEVLGQDRLVEARQAFEEGVRLLEDARYGEAATALERSLTLRESAPVLYNLGLARRGMGAYRMAITAFERFLVVGEGRDSLQRDAQTILGELRASLATVDVTLAGGATELLVDDARVPCEGGRCALPMDPGRRVFEARREGYRPVRSVLELAPGAARALTLDVGREALPARLRVETNVPEADVRLDGEPVGRGSYEGEVRPGVHDVDVRASGHVSHHRRLELAPGARERVTVSLATVASTPIYERWWFWTGVTVLVAAGVVGGIAVFSGTAEPVQGSWGTAFGAVTVGP